jgi:catalase
VLNKNPLNYFADTEQVAFSPGHLVPGFEASPDKMLQGRLFSYPDTHRHRLGANYEQIPINCPYRANTNNIYRDGPMNVNGNQGNKKNYYPNSFKTFSFSEDARYSPYRVTGLVGRHRPNHPNCDFKQPGVLFRTVVDDAQRKHMI